MKFRSFILRFAAAFLMLVFLQKTGAGLLFHNLFHVTAINESSKDRQSTKEVSYACSCIDDFLMPFTQADETVLTPVTVKHIIPVEYYSSAIPFHNTLFSSLRGPPASPASHIIA